MRRAGSARSISRSGRKSSIKNLLVNQSSGHLEVPKSRSPGPSSARGKRGSLSNSNRKQRYSRHEEINAHKIGYTKVSPINSKYHKLVNIGNIQVNVSTMHPFHN